MDNELYLGSSVAQLLTRGFTFKRVLDSDEITALYFLCDPSALGGLDTSSVELEADSGRFGVASVRVGFIVVGEAVASFFPRLNGEDAF
jgi:hypothetical protein